MTLPAGISTATLTVGVPVNFSGTPLKSYISIEPSVSLVHIATGTPLVNLIDRLDTTEGAAGQFVLPHTDQDGFQDEAGNAYKNWYYTATIQYANNKATLPERTKTFQLATGQSVVDLDLLPSGNPAMPYTAPVAGVTSVNGQTGSVVVVEATDAAVDAIVSDPESTTSDTIATAILDQTAPMYAPPTSVLQDILGRIRTNIQDVSILIYSDSTAQMTNSWARQLPAKLAELFPTHTISFRDWAEGAPGSYNAATTIAGTGTKTIHVWDGGVAGKSWQYHYDVSRREALIVTPNPDLVIFSLGHNENYALAQAGNMQTARDRAVNYIESVRSLIPAAGVVLMSQNPLTAADRDKASQYRSDTYRRIALERGYGFIDICQAFFDDGRTIAGTLVSGDGIHPTDEGHTVWVNEVVRHFRATTNSQIIPMATPAFYQALENLAPNPDFSDFSPPAAPTSWTGSNIAWTKDTTNFETGTYSLQVDKTTATSTSFQVNLPIQQVKGQWVTVAVRMWIPAGVTGNAGRIGLVTSAGNTLSDIWSDVDDQWFWRTVTGRVLPNATYARIDISLDTSTAATSTLKIDRVSAVLGRFPADPRQNASAMILTATGGTRFRVSVDDDGALTTTSL